MNSTTQTNFASKMELESNRMQQQQSGYDDFLDDDISTIIPLYGSSMLDFLFSVLISFIILFIDYFIDFIYLFSSI